MSLCERENWSGCRLPQKWNASRRLLEKLSVKNIPFDKLYFVQMTSVNPKENAISPVFGTH